METQLQAHLTGWGLAAGVRLMDMTSAGINRAPPAWRYAPADAVTAPLLALRPRLRSVVEHNFAVMLGLPDDHPKVRSLARGSVRNYGRMGIDFLRVRAMDDGEVMRRVDKVGEENLAAALSHRRGVIMALPHLGSWDVAAVYARMYGVRLTVVTESDWMAALVEGSRRRAGLTLVTRKRALRLLFRALAQNDCVAMLSDAVDNDVPSITAPFFGRAAAFPSGPARLSRHTGAPILVMTSVRQPHDRYRIEALAPIVPDRAAPPASQEAALTAAMAAGFEHFIRAFPAHWYPFHPIWPDEP